MKYLVIAFLIILWSCDAPKRAGTSTETTNGIIAGVLQHEKLPVAGAQISMYWPTGELYQAAVAQTDTAGRFTIHEVKGRYHLAAHKEHLHAWYFNVQSDVDTNLSLKSAQPGRVRIQGLQLGDSVELLGTPFRGSFTGAELVWEPVPQGNYTVLVNKNPAQNLQLNAGSDTLLQLLSLPAARDEILLDDFNQNSRVHLWVPYTGRGDWFVAAQGTAKFVQPKSGAFSQAFISTAMGQAVQIKYENNDGHSDNITQIGVHLSDQELDLQALQGVRFKVKGDCELWVALESDHNPYYRKAIWNAPVSDQWNEVYIDVSQPVTDSNYAEHLDFNQVAAQINLLTFFAFGGTELAIDDVYLVGLNPLDLLAPNK